MKNKMKTIFVMVVSGLAAAMMPGDSNFEAKAKDAVSTAEALYKELKERGYDIDSLEEPNEKA